MIHLCLLPQRWSNCEGVTCGARKRASAAVCWRQRCASRSCRLMAASCTAASRVLYAACIARALDACTAHRPHRCLKQCFWRPWVAQQHPSGMQNIKAGDIVTSSGRQQPRR